MKESYWGYWLIVLGVFVILIMLLVQNVTATNTQDYYLAKEIAEAAMIDSVDYGYYREYGEVRIVKEKFVESFVRRFAESANTGTTYKIDFYEIYEVPPKVSIKISTNSSSFNIAGDVDTFKIVNKVDMIMETDPNIKFPKNIDTIENGEYIKSIPGSSTYEVHINDGGTRIIRINDATGEVDDNCITLTATFKKGGADSISYDTFKCKVPDGGNSCKIYLPGIYKGDGNAYGWSTNENSPKTATNLMPIGETVEIKSNTTFYAITD